MTGIVVKLPSMSPKKHFEEKYLLLKTLLRYFSLRFRVIFLLFWPESLADLLKLCVCLCDVLFADFISEKVDFSKTIGIEQKHLKYLAVSIRQCCQKIKLHVQKKKEGKKIS